MKWHCYSCGKRFTNRLQRIHRAPNGRALFACPSCGSSRIERLN